FFCLNHRRRRDRHSQKKKQLRVCTSAPDFGLKPNLNHLTDPRTPTRTQRGCEARPDYCTLQDPCPLCNEAKEQLQPFRHRLVLQQVDISLPENRLWWDRYRWDIPVFHLNGQFVMKHRVDTALLDKLLQDAEGQ
uniref:Glutaredoxin-like protein n=1 Tax=Oreochromis aureus TaxID=47969 RepID=A0AAZ1XVY2_OREAU